MRSRADGDAIIAERKLANAAVSEKAGRRLIRFDNPWGAGTVEIEIDQDPSPRQLLDLEANLPRMPKEKPVDDEEPILEPDPLISPEG